MSADKRRKNLTDMVKAGTAAQKKVDALLAETESLQKQQAEIKERLAAIDREMNERAVTKSESGVEEVGPPILETAIAHGRFAATQLEAEGK